MPPRWLRWLIVLGWLTTTSWLFWHDLLPGWLPGAPPYSIDPVDEVQKSGVKTNWTVHRQDNDEEAPRPVLRASTWVDYHADDDTCTLQARLDALKDPKQALYAAKIFKIESLTSSYRVTRSGQLRSLRAEIKATPSLERFTQDLPALLRPMLKARALPQQKEPQDTLELHIWGEVHDEQFFAHCRAGSAALGNPLQFDLPPTAVSPSGSVLMPLHPVNRIRGLRPGQSWRQPLVDPLRDAFAALPGFSGGVRSLQARVLPQPRTLRVGEIDMNCLVIEYADEEHETVGRTWVEEESEQVQQQEAYLEDGRWMMKRELSPHRSYRPSRK
jgi:hypothetical protein